MSFTYVKTHTHQNKQQNTQQNKNQTSMDNADYKLEHDQTWK